MLVFVQTIRFDCVRADESHESTMGAMHYALGQLREWAVKGLVGFYVDAREFGQVGANGSVEVRLSYSVQSLVDCPLPTDWVQCGFECGRILQQDAEQDAMYRYLCFLKFISGCVDTEIVR